MLKINFIFTFIFLMLITSNDVLGQSSSQVSLTVGDGASGAQVSFHAWGDMYMPAGWPGPTPPRYISAKNDGLVRAWSDDASQGFAKKWLQIWHVDYGGNQQLDNLTWEFQENFVEDPTPFYGAFPMEAKLDGALTSDITLTGLPVLENYYIRVFAEVHAWVCPRSESLEEFEIHTYAWTPKLNMYIR